MGITLSIIKTRVILVLLVFIACIGLSAFAITSLIVPQIDRFIDHGVRMYDDIFPEIRIKNGKASISKQQPYLVDKIDEKYFTVIIDTRDGKQGEALNYLSNAPSGLVLTQDAVVMKNSGQIRVIPLKNIPDIVLNSATLNEITDKYLPLVKPVVGISAVIYFSIGKAIQILILSLIPFFWASSAKVPISYGQALKISVFGMALPVIVEVLSYLSETRIPGWFYIYFGFYVILMFLASTDLVRSLRASADAPSIIQP